MPDRPRSFPEPTDPWDTLTAAAGYLREAGYWAAAATLRAWRGTNLAAPDQRRRPGASREALTAAATMLAARGEAPAAAALASWREANAPGPDTRSGHRWREFWELSEDIDDESRRFEERCEHCALTFAYRAGLARGPGRVAAWAWPGGRWHTASDHPIPPCETATASQPEEKEVSLCSSSV